MSPAASTARQARAALDPVASMRQLLSVRPVALALALTALVTAARLSGTVDSDVAWQLWIAGRLHAGATLYRDIIETNPPLWFWMAMPVERSAAFLSVQPETMLVLAIGGLTAGALAATARVTRYIAPPRRAMLLAYAALILAAMPWVHVGQREQLALIAALPYAALIASRSDRAAVPTALAVLVGVGAALGFALKHYFLLVPLLLEYWLWRRARSTWQPLRPEMASMVAIGSIYAITAIMLAPAFFTEIVPLVRLAYGSTGAGNLFGLLNPFSLLAIITLAWLAGAVALVRTDNASLPSALLVAAIAFTIAYAAQHKGWTYHTLPALGCAAIGLAALLAQAPRVPTVIRLTAPALLALPLVLAARESVSPALPNAELRQAVAGLRPGDPVAFIASETAVAWSVTLQRRLRYASRYNGYWMLMAIAENERRPSPDPRLQQLWRRVVADTVADYRCSPPKRIIVARPRPGEKGFDVLPMFTRDRAFAALLSHYRVSTRSTFETYERVSALPAIDPSRCRRGV